MSANLTEIMSQRLLSELFSNAKDALAKNIYFGPLASPVRSILDFISLMMA